MADLKKMKRVRLEKNTSKQIKESNNKWISCSDCNLSFWDNLGHMCPVTIGDKLDALMHMFWQHNAALTESFIEFRLNHVIESRKLLKESASAKKIPVRRNGNTKASRQPRKHTKRSAKSP